MKILVLNCGSSSLKYQLINMETEKVVAIGLCERIGIDGNHKYENFKGEKIVYEDKLPNHKTAISKLLEALLNEQTGVISVLNEINAIGHRVVHGGEFFTKSVIIDEEVKAAIKDCIDLAPLHNPANLEGINVCEVLIPSIKQVAVFDTAFHQTMPEKSFLYSLPYEMYEKNKVRRYGFHGTSHLYVSDRASKLLNKPIEETKIITCHLGNGASVCAIDSGKSIDTSMGFTPLEGLTMGTRCGDIDPAIVTYIMRKENLTSEEVDNYLNKKSGVLGISGVSSDFRDIEESAENNNKKAKIALDIFSYKVAKYIGQYMVALGGVDAVVFTAGIGENGIEMRKSICEYLEFLGLEIDEDKNNCRGKEVIFTTEKSKIKAMLIPTNEELVIARDTKNLLDN